jgi:HEPN domain-containing protein
VAFLTAKNRKDFQEISRLRWKEAKALLKLGHYPGAYYLAGYAVECALKACIAKQTKRHDFPDKNVAGKAWVHDLGALLKLAGLEPALDSDMSLNKTLELNWAVAKDWDESARYAPILTEVQARELHSACGSRKNGILPWIRKRW